MIVHNISSCIQLTHFNSCYNKINSNARNKFSFLNKSSFSQFINV